jgi:glutamate formiminotransferase/formiminotetrahydrofolate cyclodeaminase
MRLIECVPNFSEGRNDKIINAIADAIRAVPGIRLLDIDPGWSTNRTVMTFVGEPEAAEEAAFQAVATAQNLIDMRKHRGEHPRLGSTDVCPFIPVSGVFMDECVQIANRLGKRVGEQLNIPVYLYANAAKRPERQSLADIRQGEYEALPSKLMKDSFRPDFGPAEFNAQSGATVIGAREFLIAYNVNLNTKSKKLANEIAFKIREAGRAKKDADGKSLKDSQGKTIKQPGTLKACRAVGWYVEEYQRAQVSINLLDFNITSLHQAFDECCSEAELLGVRVTGSEIIGLVPLAPMLQAGRHYLSKQKRSTGVSEQELTTVAIQSLGLSDLSPFDRLQKIIEYKVRPPEVLLSCKSVSDFMDELASESMAPGGGSVSALCAALSASLASMVANLTFEKKGYETNKPLMDELANKAQRLKSQFLQLIDADVVAFNKIIEARRLPKDSEIEIAARDKGMFAAIKEAIDVPFLILSQCQEALQIAETVIEKGNPNSLSDGGVAVLNAVSAAEGAYMNVLINLAGLGAHDEQGAFKAKIAHTSRELIEAIRNKGAAIKAAVYKKLEEGIVLDT